MRFEVELTCEKCGANGYLTMSLPAPKVNISVGGKITTNQTCPLCGGDLTSPSGDYEVRDGKLVRIGDFGTSK